MRAGLLRHSVTIEYKTETPTDHLEVVEAWATLATVRARVTPKSSEEGSEADRAVPRRTHEVVIRSGPAVTADMRINHGGRLLYIVGPPRDFEERGIHLTLDCKETL